MPHCLTRPCRLGIPYTSTYRDPTVWGGNREYRDVYATKTFGHIMWMRKYQAESMDTIHAQIKNIVYRLRFKNNSTGNQHCFLKSLSPSPPRGSELKMAPQRLGWSTSRSGTVFGKHQFLYHQIWAETSSHSGVQPKPFNKGLDKQSGFYSDSIAWKNPFAFNELT
jgi:hypothetical protein